MRWNIISLSLAAIFRLFSCNNSDKIPDNIINQEKMGILLYDITMAEGHIEVHSFTDSTFNKDSMLMKEMDKVLAIHKISSKEFSDSYQFYKSHPEIFKVITDTLIDRTQRSRDNTFGNKPEKIRIRKEKRK